MQELETQRKLIQISRPINQHLNQTLQTYDNINIKLSKTKPKRIDKKIIKKIAGTRSNNHK